MNPKDFKASSAGRCIRTLQRYWAFVPHPLPPTLALDWELVRLLSDADRALSELSGAGRLLLNPHLLIGPYMRREAVLSSRIENTQAGMSDLFFFEADETGPLRAPDVKEVANYMSAMDYGLARLKELPISIRLVREIHRCDLCTTSSGGNDRRARFLGNVPAFGRQRAAPCAVCADALSV